MDNDKPLKENKMSKKTEEVAKQPLAPLGEWIITKEVKLSVQEKKSLIIRPLSAQNEKVRQKYVEVIAIGATANEDNLIAVGQVIMVPEVTGMKVVHADVEYEMHKLPNMICIVA